MSYEVSFTSGGYHSFKLIEFPLGDNNDNWLFICSAFKALSPEGYKVGDDLVVRDTFVTVTIHMEACRANGHRGDRNECSNRARKAVMDLMGLDKNACHEHLPRIMVCWIPHNRIERVVAAEIARKAALEAPALAVPQAMKADIAAGMWWSKTLHIKLCAVTATALLLLSNDMTVVVCDTMVLIADVAYSLVTDPFP
jgi:hypothetical protein